MSPDDPRTVAVSLFRFGVRIGNLARMRANWHSAEWRARCCADLSDGGPLYPPGLS